MRYLPLILLVLAGCKDKKDPHEPWYPHVPTSWRVTPDGHTRDAGPFASVAAGWETEEDLDAAVDLGFSTFKARLGFIPVEMPVGLNDDYCIWYKWGRRDVQGIWASGFYTSGEWLIHVAIWSRLETVGDPGPAWIVRSPGNYWGVDYPNYRHTGLPLAPAVAHELLHVSIGDPQHSSPLWTKLEGSRKAGETNHFCSSDY